MKRLLCVSFLCLLTASVFAQNISGKWVGKISQGPGGYSELYDFDLELTQSNTNLKGESYAYITDIVDVRIGLAGTIKNNDIQLRESKQLILREKLPTNWILCIKNLLLKYRKEGDHEYLQGDWNGVSKEDSDDPCVPGEIILARTKEDIQLFLSNGGFKTPIPESNAANLPLPDFTPDFHSTAVNKINEIEVYHRDIQIRLSDYLNVDNDTISVYLNRNPLAKNVWISKRPVRIDFKMDNRLDLNEILLFAENLGKIPPNTSQMLLIDGNKKHIIKIESDKQKTAAIYLRYKPIKSK